jgi:hypothetical protein
MGERNKQMNEMNIYTGSYVRPFESYEANGETMYSGVLGCVKRSGKDEEIACICTPEVHEQLSTLPIGTKITGSCALRTLIATEQPLVRPVIMLLDVREVTGAVEDKVFLVLTGFANPYNPHSEESDYRTFSLQFVDEQNDRHLIDCIAYDNMKRRAAELEAFTPVTVQGFVHAQNNKGKTSTGPINGMVVTYIAIKNRKEGQ